MLGGIEGIMNLAAASGESLATTSDIVTDALTAFGLTAADSGHFADVLAAASSNANTNVSMMGETFKYAAPIAGALGFSVEDTAEAIGLMANAGIKSTQAGTSLRTIMANLSGEVKICVASIGEVTIATTNADGSMRELSDILADCRVAFNGLSESEKAAAAESLAGKNAMSGFLALMNAAPADIEKLSSAIDSCNGKSEEMATIMQDNLTGQLTILKSALEELAISFGELLITIMSSLAQEESRSLSENVTWGQRKAFSDGKIRLPYKQFLGNERGADGLPQIVPEQAEIVRRIYSEYISGKTTCAIAKGLTMDGIPTPSGKTKWSVTTVESILTNEKYKGDTLLQKSFTTD